MTLPFTHLLALICLVLTAALFGFFYAWVCSTMWGLDAADPRTAIAAMQAMNASVRNVAFAPAFFGTPLALAITTIVLFRIVPGGAAGWFGAATLLVITLSFLLTISVNVPMNEALAEISVPQDIEATRAIWQDYSTNWQFWNQIRAVGTGLAVLCTGVGLLRL